MNLSRRFDYQKNRCFITCGLSNDRYFLPSGIEASYAKMMHDHLSRHGYATIVFLSSKGLFFLDPISEQHAMTLPEPSPAAAQGTLAGGLAKLKPAPAGLRLGRNRPAHVAQAQSPPSGARLLYPGMKNLANTIDLLQKVLLHPNQAGVVVFEDIHLLETIKQETKVRFKALINHQLPGAAMGNCGIVVFNVPDYLSDRETARRRLLEDLCPDAASVYIGSPDADEVRAFFMQRHLCADVVLDWPHLECMTRLTARHVKANQLRLNFLDTFRADDRIDMDRVVNLSRGNGLSARERLARLSGRGEVKQYVQNLETRIRSLREQEQAQTHSDLLRLVPAPIPDWRKKAMQHLLLTGNPGVGKTTTAHLLGERYAEMELLPVGHTVKVTRADLVAGYVGQSALKTRAAIEQAMGGVLFLDEAYALVQGGENDFGQEAIATLVEAMTDRAGAFVVIAAGYPEEMKQFLEGNAGLESRFAEKIHLEDYSPEQLAEILEQALHAEKAPPDESLQELLLPLCRRIHAERPAHFGNARDMEKLASQVAREMAVRHLDQATPECLPAQTQALLEKPDVGASGVLDELSAMIGLDSVKHEVTSLFHVIAADRKRKGPDAVAHAGHFVFTGNPGTGKTTVARLMMEQFFALGLIPKRQFKACSATELIQGYVGQSAVKTREFLVAGLGGVLFLDEAHQLAQDPDSRSYARDIIHILVPFAEDHRKECIIILAGYEKPMQALLKSDPGLSGRFANKIHFPDYMAGELVAIFERMLQQEHLRWPAEACRTHMEAWFTALKRERGDHFGNAREVRNTLEQCKKRQGRRLHERMQSAADEQYFELEPEDLPTLEEII